MDMNPFFQHHMQFVKSVKGASICENIAIFVTEIIVVGLEKDPVDNNMQKHNRFGKYLSHLAYL